MLVLIFSIFLWLLPKQDESELIILILDDCTNWGFKENEYPPNEENIDEISNFSLSKNWIKGPSGLDRYVWLSHLWNYLIYQRGEEGKGKSILLLTYSQILNLHPIYSSETSFPEWDEIKRRSYNKLIYVMLPSDYCSDNRFVFDYKFKLYQVNLTLPYSE
jgi:hypothetical protein